MHANTYYIVQVNLTSDEYSRCRVYDMLTDCGFKDLTWLGSTGPPYTKDEIGAVRYKVLGSEENLAMLTLKHENIYYRED